MVSWKISVVFVLYILFVSTICVEIQQDINAGMFLARKQVTVFSPDNSSVIGQISEGRLIIGYRFILLNDSNNSLSNDMFVVHPLQGVIRSAFRLLPNQSSTDPAFYASSFIIELTIMKTNVCEMETKYYNSRKTLISCEFGDDWLHQWPIGNGYFGALVDGSPSLQVMPLSIADLYVNERSSFYENINQESNVSHIAENIKAFRSSRKNLRNRQFESAEKDIGQILKYKIGKFEYAADFVIGFHPTRYGRRVNGTSPRRMLTMVENARRFNERKKRIHKQPKPIKITHKKKSDADNKPVDDRVSY